MPSRDRSSSPPAPADERRGDRRTNSLLSLAHLLDAVRHRGSWEAVVLADNTGCLIAGGGAAAVCEELAAYAPFIEHDGSPANDTVPCRLDIVSVSRVQRVCIDGMDVLLCATGKRGTRETLEDAAAGASRILGRRSFSPATSG